jgi:hypothetical protein
MSTQTKTNAAAEKRAREERAAAKRQLTLVPPPAEPSPADAAAKTAETLKNGRCPECGYAKGKHRLSCATGTREEQKDSQTPAPATSANPFLCPDLGPGVETIDAEGRLRKVKDFGVEQLRQVLALDGLQKSVRDAAERRLKALEAKASPRPKPTPGTRKGELDPLGARDIASRIADIANFLPLVNSAASRETLAVMDEVAVEKFKGEDLLRAEKVLRARRVELMRTRPELFTVNSEEADAARQVELVTRCATATPPVILGARDYVARPTGLPGDWKVVKIRDENGSPAVFRVTPPERKSKDAYRAFLRSCKDAHLAEITREQWREWGEPADYEEWQRVVSGKTAKGDAANVAKAAPKGAKKEREPSKRALSRKQPPKRKDGEGRKCSECGALESETLKRSPNYTLRKGLCVDCYRKARASAKK